MTITKDEHRREAETAIAAEIGRVVGGVRGMTTGEHHLKTGAEALEVVVRTEGWGPSLHLRWMEWTNTPGIALWRQDMLGAGATTTQVRRTLQEAELSARMHGDMPDIYRGGLTEFTPERIARAYGEDLDADLAPQRASALYADARGLTAPLPMPTDRHDVRIDHITVDRALLQLMLHASTGREVVDRLRIHLFAALIADGVHREKLTGLQGRITDGVIDEFSVQRHNGAPLYREVQRLGAGQQAVYNGDHIRISNPLPETVLAASVGHRVSRVLETTSEALNHAIILAAWNQMGERAVLTMESDEIELATHPDIAPFL